MAFSSTETVRKQLRSSRKREKRRSLSKNQPNASKVRRMVNNTATTDKSVSDDVYFVEAIIDEKISKGQKLYKVRWQGFPPESDSWEPEVNLTSVKNLIQAFRHRTNLNKSISSIKESKSLPANSPVSSLHTPPTPMSSQSCMANPVDRSRTGSQDRLRLVAETKSRPRRGCFEYVPQSQLIAAKTKYFDDIRDGKIDLSSNDLYSRVKTRRRALNDAEPNHSSQATSSESGSNTLDGGWVGAVSLSSCSIPTRPSSPKIEPTSPSVSADLGQATDSLSGLQSIADSIDLTENIKCFLDVHGETDSNIGNCIHSNNESTVSELIDDDVQSVGMPTKVKDHDETHPNPGLVDRESQTHQTICSVSTSTHMNLENSSSQTALNNRISQILVDCASSPIDPVIESANNHDVRSIETETLSPDASCPNVVRSLRDVVRTYLELFSTNSNDGGSESLTCLISTPPPLRLIRTYSDFLSALVNQHWHLLQCIPNYTGPGKTVFSLSKDLLLPPPPGGQRHHRRRLRHSAYSDLYALVNCSDRPFLLERLLDCGLDPNTNTTTSSYPDDDKPEKDEEDRRFSSPVSLLAIAVQCRRPHTCQLLLDAGADPNSPCLEAGHRSVLGAAICAGDYDMVSLLVLACANFYEVEADCTAFKLIDRLLRSGTTNTRSLPELTRLGSLRLLANVDRKSSLESGHIPLPAAHDDGYYPAELPQKLLLSALVNSATTDRSRPSVDSLSRIHQLLNTHHARLSSALNKTVSQWLASVGLKQFVLITPPSWLCLVKPCSSTHHLAFHLPLFPSTTATTQPVPILFAVHGRLTPPAAYDLWLDGDDESLSGECWIRSVKVTASDDEVTMVDQRSLTPSGLFVSTLLPPPPASSTSSSVEYTVWVDFTSPAVSDCRGRRPPCVALLIVAVVPDNQQQPHSTNQLLFHLPTSPTQGSPSFVAPTDG